MIKLHSLKNTLEEILGVPGWLYSGKSFEIQIPLKIIPCFYFLNESSENIQLVNKSHYEMFLFVNCGGLVCCLLPCDLLFSVQLLSKGSGGAKLVQFLSCVFTVHLETTEPHLIQVHNPSVCISKDVLSLPLNVLQLMAYSKRVFSCGLLFCST